MNKEEPLQPGSHLDCKKYKALMRVSQWVTGSLGSSNDTEAGSEASVPVSQWVAGSLMSSNEAEAGDEAGVRVSQWVTGSLGSSNDAEAGSEAVSLCHSG